MDFQEIFETLAQPTAACDEDGVILACNESGRKLLGLGPQAAGVRIGLDERDTFASMQVSRTSSRALEFFLADVPIYGASIPRAAISVTPLRDGGYRVSFVEGTAHRSAPSERLLSALSRITEHAALFESLDEFASLLGSCLVDVFPDYAFRLEARVEGARGFVEVERAYEPRRGRRLDTTTSLDGAGEVDPGDLLWSESGAGYRVLASTRGLAALQLETTRARGFTSAEVQAFELFMHMFEFLGRRHIEREARADQLELMAPILNELHAVVLVCDARRMLRTCNKAFEAAMGRAGDELMGLDVMEFFEESARPMIRAAGAAAMSGTPGEPFTARLMGSHGLELSLHAVPTGASLSTEVRGFLLIGQVSATSLRELQDEFARAEHLMQLGQLATGVAHELKNPLTSILNYADYLLQKYRDQLFEKRDSERLVRIIEGVERMDQFVRDLVTLARPSSEREREVVNLHDVVAEAVYLCEVPLRQHHATVTQALDAQESIVRGVPSQLVQVLVNLLSNAALALGDSGGVIRIVTKTDAGMLRCQVIDDGCGIAPELMERIFEPFYTTHKGQGGSGLGLVLVRSIIERHEGRVEVMSQESVGTTFELVLPLYRPKEVA